MTFICYSIISVIIYCTLYVCILVTQYIAPGSVRELSYKVITNTSVNITWKPPEKIKEPTGNIVSYFVEHGAVSYTHLTLPTIYSV